jgi:hypothetical protein
MIKINFRLQLCAFKPIIYWTTGQFTLNTTVSAFLFVLNKAHAYYIYILLINNSVALVRERIISTERSVLVGEVSANFRA